jgi:hypothetical protein
MSGRLSSEQVATFPGIGNWIARATIKELNANAELDDFAKVQCMVHGDDACEINVEIK